MENSRSGELEMLTRELIQGSELAKRLREELSSISPTPDKEVLLAEGIVSSYEKALSALNLNESITMIYSHTVAAVKSFSTSPTFIDGSPKSDSFDTSFKELNEQNKCFKKRKSLPSWTKQVRVTSETGLEGLCEDGHSWRKYGQKDILGSKFPRSYYRCTFRNTQDCWATKQVQRCDEDPSVFEMTYRGEHTCSHGNQTIPPPVSQEKQEQDDDHDNCGNNIEHELQLQKTASTFGWTEKESHNFSHTVMDDSTYNEYLSTTPDSSYLMQFPFEKNPEEFQSLHQSETSTTDFLLNQQIYSNYFELGFHS